MTKMLFGILPIPSYHVEDILNYAENYIRCAIKDAFAFDL